MQTLIVDDDPQRQADLTMAFMRLGFQTSTTGAQNVAELCLRRLFVDLLVIGEIVGRRLTHSLALLAEYRNPMVATFMLTARTDADTDELFELLPSLHCLLAPDSAPELITRLALASVSGAVQAGGPLILSPTLRRDEAGVRTPVFTSARAPVGLQQVA